MYYERFVLTSNLSSDLAADIVRVWEEKVIIPTYGVGTPNKNPMFLEKRVYQGSSGVVYCSSTPPSPTRARNVGGRRAVAVADEINANYSSVWLAPDELRLRHLRWRPRLRERPVGSARDR